MQPGADSVERVVVRVLGEEGGNIADCFGQYRRKRDGDVAEHVESGAEHDMQVVLAVFLLGQFPGCRVGDVFVGDVGGLHDAGDGLGVFAALIERDGLDQHGFGRAHREQGLLLNRGGVHRKPGGRRPEGARYAIVEVGCQELRAAAGDVDELADQIRVHALHEVLEVEIEVVDAGAGLGGVVVAQSFGVEAGVEVGAGLDEGAARFGHLGAVDGEVTVDVQSVRRLQLGAVQHGRPEQAVEVDDVLAQEVVHAEGTVRGEDGLEIQTLLRTIGLEAGQVADWRIQPDVEELAGRIGNGEAEVGRVAADVPVAQAAVQPFAQLGLDRRVRHVAGQPALQERLEFRQLEEVVLGFAKLRHRAGHRRARVLQVGGGVGRAADLAVVAVLVGGAALRAVALDVAVGQEHAALGIEQLLDAAHGNDAGLAQRPVDARRQLAVFLAVRGVIVVERDVEGGEIALVAGLDVADEVLRRHTGLLRSQHDRRAVGVVGADEMHGLAGHAPRTNPDVGLDIAHQMAEVQVAVGVGQGAGDESLLGAGHCRFGLRGAAHYSTPCTARAAPRHMQSRGSCTE